MDAFRQSYMRPYGCIRQAYMWKKGGGRVAQIMSLHLATTTSGKLPSPEHTKNENEMPSKLHPELRGWWWEKKQLKTDLDILRDLPMSFSSSETCPGLSAV